MFRLVCFLGIVSAIGLCSAGVTIIAIALSAPAQVVWMIGPVVGAFGGAALIRLF
jgi:hypothetical protein